MNIEIFAGEGDFYIRLPGGSMALRWFCEAGNWINAKEKPPDRAQRVEFGDLPGELREEILAFVARAEAMGNQIWDSQN